MVIEKIKIYLQKSSLIKPDVIICLCFFTLYYFLFDFSVSFVFIVFATLLFSSNLFAFGRKGIRVAFVNLVFFTSSMITPPTIDFNNIGSKTVSSYALNFSEKNDEYTHYFNPSGLFFYPDSTLACVGKVARIRYATMINTHSEMKKLIFSVSCLHNDRKIKIDLQDVYALRLYKYKLGVWAYLLNAIVYLILTFFIGVRTQ